MSLSLKILLSMILALLLGMLATKVNHPVLVSISEILSPVGTLWVNAIRMTVIPLLMSLLITAIAGQHARQNVGIIGVHTSLLIIVLIFLSSALTFLLSPLMLSFISIDPLASQALMDTVAGQETASAALPPFSQWLISIVPVNPLQSAVNNAILPLMVFTALFAMAVRQIDEVHRNNVCGFFEGIKQAMFVLIGWVMKLAPVGVFALVYSLSSTMGLAAAKALASFIVVASLTIVLISVLLYVLVVMIGKIPFKSFVKAVAPVQVIGFSTRSSLASLPATYEATRKLGIPSDISGVVLPLAVTMFKFASPVARISGTYFIAQLYGIELGVLQMAVIAMAIGLLSFYSPGIPSGGLLVMSPVYFSLGLPIQGIGILIAVDLIIDMFITAANVTANVCAAALVAQFHQR